jgi:hypothetical protein
MLAVETLDYGSAIKRLRAFGPPEVVALAGGNGTATPTEVAAGYLELVAAVTLSLAAAGGGAPRSPRLRWFAGESVPFAEVVAPFTVASGSTSQVTFAAGVYPAGANNAPTIVVPIPSLLLLPGYTLELDVLAGAAGDTLAGVRVSRQRFQLVDACDADEPARNAAVDELAPLSGTVQLPAGELEY